MSRSRRPLPLALFAPLLVACQAGPSGFNPEDGLTPTLPVAWTEVKTGGETLCARGAPYSFFVFPGKKNRVLIDFMGGGACWTKETCAVGQAIFGDTIDLLKDQVIDRFPGIYDRLRQQNPLLDYYHVVVPYCTGDVHWGDSVVTYAPGLTIHHKGAVNARAVLDWVYRNFPAPEQILVTGCSAGAYGSIYWTPHLRQHYPKAKLVQLGDSGAGVVTANFFRDSFPLWQATSAAPAFIPDLDPKKVQWQELSLDDLYIRVGRFYPEVQLGQFNTLFDEVQTFFYEQMGGRRADWSPKMQASIANIQRQTPSFRAFLGPTQQHCILPEDNYLTFESDGVRFGDWLRDLAAGRPVASVECRTCAR